MDKQKKGKLLDNLATILLSAATILSSWCIFQSSQWSGEQYFRIDDETAANQFRLQKEVEASQRQTAHLQMFLQYTSAKASGNEELAEFIYQRFPDDLKLAFNAWKQLDPMNNPNAPPSPFVMKEYVIKEVIEAKDFADKAIAFKKEANESDQRSDNYLLLSLILSMVLFFSGISATVNSQTNKIALLSTAGFIFLVVVVYLTTMPVIF